MKPEFLPTSMTELQMVDTCADYPATTTEVLGLISQSGQGASIQEGYNVHLFSLSAWRHSGQNDVTERDLTILRPIPSDSSWSDFPAGTIHKMQLLVSIDETRAVFSNLIESHVHDPGLELIALQLRKPVTIQTERFGELVLNRRVNWFEGWGTWAEDEIEISFESGGDRDISNQLEVANELFAQQLEWSKRVNDFALEQLLHVANDWRETEVETITADEFLGRMSLNSISFKRDGSFEFWHSDGDLFFGHAIQISGSLSDGLTYADIPG